MNLDQLVNNPVGSGSANVGARYLIKNVMASKADGMIKNKKIEANFHKIGTSFVAHFKVESETFDNLFYDIVLEFYPTSDVIEAQPSLSKYDIRMISNIPAFAFTYAYVLNKNEMIIPELKNKFDKIFWSDAPSVRNLSEVYGFEKSIQYVALYIKNLLFLNKAKFLVKSSGKESSWKEINSGFREFAVVMEDYTKNLNKQRAAKRKLANDEKEAPATRSNSKTLQAKSKISIKRKSKVKRLI
jgi:hypothetical protein